MLAFIHWWGDSRFWGGVVLGIVYAVAISLGMKAAKKPNRKTPLR